MIVIPNMEWYLNISTRGQLSHRCPYASVYRCSRFYQSLSLMGEAGSTKINDNEDEKLKRSWQKTDVWPITTEQATSISGHGDETKHFSHFCPEVAFDRFGLFATELHKYADEIDISVAHKELLARKALPDDWRWNWDFVEPMHYSECPLYSLLRDEKGRSGPKPTFPNVGLPNSITTRPISVTEGDHLTAEDIEKLIKDVYDHPEITSFEVYYIRENPYLAMAIDDFRISSDTVETHYYKLPDRDLSFAKVHENSVKSDWEKRLIATSPMYFKRVIALTDRERTRLDRERNQTIWNKILTHPVFVMLAILGSIASIIGFWSFFR